MSKFHFQMFLPCTRADWVVNSLPGTVIALLLIYACVRVRVCVSTCVCVCVCVFKDVKRSLSDVFVSYSSCLRRRFSAGTCISLLIYTRICTAYMYTCIYKYMMYTYTYIYMYICTYIYIYIYVLYIYIHVHIYQYIYTHIYEYKYAKISKGHSQIVLEYEASYLTLRVSHSLCRNLRCTSAQHACIYTYIYTHIYLCIYIYMYIYICIYI